MCSIGVGERLHKVLGQIDLGSLDSGERLFPFGLLVSKLYDVFGFMFGFMIDISPKFYAIPSPPHYMILRSRSHT